MASLHTFAASPSPLVAVVAAALIHRVRPDWLAIGVTEAAQAEGFNPERVSRLCSRVQQAWQAALELCSRRGRPPQQPTQQDEVALLRAVLAVATTLLTQVNLGRPVLRALVVGAWLRLRSELPHLTQQRFCQALALPARTLRSWLSAQSAPPRSTPESSPAPALSTQPCKPRVRRLRRPRFRFDLVVPDTQIGADTTDLSVLGIPLKLMAAQDIGGRDRALFDSVVIDDHESAEHVVDVFTTAIAGREGLQAITDQGTPYMAKATRDALAELGVEHAPQREGDPLGKSTVERGFGILKTVAAPLLTLSDRVAQVVPALRDVELAKSLGHLLVVTLLRAYQAGARAARRATEQRSGLDEEALTGAAARAREQARAEEDSKRLLLTHLHELYHFDLPVAAFIRSYRRYPLAVLKQAESKLRSQLHRNDIRSLSRYFGAIVRDTFEHYQADRARRNHVDQQCANSVAQAQQAAALRHARLTNPVSWLRDALTALANQWLPAERRLLFGGEGAALGWLRGALHKLAHVHGPNATLDIAHAVVNQSVRAHQDRLGQSGAHAIHSLLQRELNALLAATPDSSCASSPPLATLWNTGRTQRPPAPNPLPT
jgi:transposase InsO family protein